MFNNIYLEKLSKAIIENNLTEKEKEYLKNNLKKINIRGVLPPISPKGMEIGGRLWDILPVIKNFYEGRISKSVLEYMNLQVKLFGDIKVILEENLSEDIIKIVSEYYLSSPGQIFKFYVVDELNNELDNFFKLISNHQNHTFHY